MVYEDHGYYESEIGFLKVEGGADGITSVEFDESARKSERAATGKPYGPISECIKQLKEYFNGERKAFDLALLIEGTEFQRRVWGALLDIPYGETVSYGYIARKIGKDRAARAVGNANNRNRFAIVIPCHRVIGAAGDLRGYAKGTDRKEWLINHEKRNL